MKPLKSLLYHRFRTVQLVNVKMCLIKHNPEFRTRSLMVDRKHTERLMSTIDPAAQRHRTQTGMVTGRSKIHLVQGTLDILEKQGLGLC